MVDIIFLQETFYTAGAIGVLLAAINYIITARANQRNMKHTLETRHAQLLMGLFQGLWNRDSSKSLTNVFTQQWNKPEEFWERLRTDTDLYADYSFVVRYFDSIGYLVKSGFLESEQVYDMLDGGRPFIMMWSKYGDLLKSRRLTEGQAYAVNLEYLYDEMVRLRKLHGEPLDAHHSRSDPRDIGASSH
jgi:hypothetical protein